MNTTEHILSYWFGDEFVDGYPSKPRDALWFQSSPKTDQEIKSRFAPDIERAAKGQLDLWRKEPRGLLALITLLDQFPRNVYRGTARAFAYDARARELCMLGIDRGADKELRSIERTFFYLPLEHSEQLADQNLCVELMEKLVEEVSARHKKKALSYLSYARSHQKIIAEFGRFPHRNAILGRESSLAEAEFLQTGPNFGQ